MIARQIQELVAAARKDGWACATAKLDVLHSQARLSAFLPIVSRRGQSQIDVLTPIDQGHAPRRSLSSRYGVGPQPLHTDGAHLVSPPDIVILAAKKPSPVPTLLWRGDLSRAALDVREDLAHGLFVVDNGINRFLAPAYGSGRYRYDPGCMRPGDSRAQRVLEYFEDARASATAFDWTECDQVLVIDNRTVLHARADAAADLERELRRIMIRIEEGETP